MSTTINLTPRQVELLAAVCEVMKADIDWTRVATLANLKTSKYARDSWTVVRNRLTATLASGATSAPAAVADGDGDDDEGTATKQGKAAKGAKGKRKNGADDENDTAVKPKKKATPRSKSKKATAAEEAKDGPSDVKDESES